MGGSNVKAVTRVTFKPILHDIDDFRWRSNEAKASHAGHLPVEFTDRWIFSLHALQQPRADAAQLRRSELGYGHRTIDGISRQITKGLAEARQSNERIKQLLQLIVFRSGFGGRPCD